MRRAARSIVVGFVFGAASASAQPEANSGAPGSPPSPAPPPAGGPLNPNGSVPAAALPEPAPPLKPRPPPEQVLPPTSGSGRVVTLAEAEASALAHQPQIMQARAQTRASDARVDEAFAPLLPQVQGTASYGRRTGNFVPQAGALPGSARVTTKSSFDTYDSFNFGLTASQLIYDFGQTSGGYHVAQANAEGQKVNEATVELSVLLGVRTAYALAWANRALVSVARETLENGERHLEQIEGLVHAGARPEIDLAQVKADRANANLQLINAENSYATAKAQLNQSMGVEESTDYDVGGETAAPVSGEDLDERRLVGLAVETRPEMKGLEKQSEADARQLSATKGAYGPSLGVQTSLTDGGRDLTALAWNWSATANLTWPLFQGGITKARIREAEANQDVTRSQIALERQQIRLEITQARLSIRGAKAALDASREVELNARERLRLAEARYRAGAGSIIELEDAQVGATTAAGQVVQAEYGLAVARAQLAKGLGQR
ncbi:MAG TPA: TolC family protein [Polyangiaceae bacterium]